MSPSLHVTTHSAPAIVLHGEQAEALEQILAHLDQPTSNKLIALFGARGSGKTALIQALLGVGGQPARTPKGRRVLSLVIDLLRLREDTAEWQVLLFALLEALSRQPNAPSALRELTGELARLVHTVGYDEGADLAMAAFMHRFRTAFAEALGRVGAPNGAVLVVAIDHVDKARPERALAMLEAARYFLSRPECALLACAHEDSLADDVRDVLRGWMTMRVDLREARVAQAPARGASSGAKATRPALVRDLPPACADLFLEHLGSSGPLLARAVERWRAALRALVQRGERYDEEMAALVAQLCLLRELSPSLFDAATLDVALLPELERHARGGLPSTHPWADAISRDEPLWRFFADAARFVGVDLWALAAAVRAVKYAEVEPGSAPGAKRAPRAETTTARLAPPAHQVQPTRAASGQLWQLLFVAGASFALDRSAKLIAEAGGSFVLSLAAAISDPLSAAASTAADLSSVVLCAVLLALWGNRRTGVYGVAYGLLLGGLLANLADRLVYGAVMNLFRVGTLPMFNLAHASMLIGAALLAWALVSRADRGES